MLRILLMQQQNYTHRIVVLLKQAQKIATENGFHNLLQPGLVKELIIADILGHNAHKTKHQADAQCFIDPTIKFEYLSCFEYGTFQIDRMFKSPESKRQKSLERITRNTAIYCSIFEKQNPLTVSRIYEVLPEVLLKETERQLNESTNDISHISFSTKWVIENGEKVYADGKLLKNVNKRSTSSVSKRINHKSQEHTQLGFIFTTGAGENDNHTDHHSRTVQRQDIDHSPQKSGRNSVGCGSTEVVPSEPLTRIEDHGQPEPEIVRLEFGRRYLFDKP
jgi:hypothetical protein